MTRKRSIGLLILGLGLPLAACVGTLEDLFDPGGGPNAAPDAEVARLHRLNPTQYRNTVRDLLGLDETQAASVSIPADEGDVPSLLTVTRLDEAATYLASLGAHRTFLPCDPAGEGSD